MSLSIRPATARDAPQIKQLIRQVQINPMDLNWRRFVLAVDDSDAMLGCGQVKVHGGGILELASIAVKPESRGLGVARAIIEHLIARAPRPLYLTCLSSLGPFYEKWGFRALGRGEMPAYFQRLSRLASTFMHFAGHGESLLVMVLK